jgi:hypothetical protein
VNGSVSFVHALDLALGCEGPGHDRDGRGNRQEEAAHPAILANCRVAANPSPG